MKVAVLSFFVASCIRLIGGTLRLRVEDRGGLLQQKEVPPFIWCFWHNGIFVMPFLFRRYFPRRSASVLTSASRDGTIIAAIMQRFGIEAARGSSSRGGLRALLECKRFLERGYDATITPDGPRGPRYGLQGGIVKLAERSGAAILPVRIRFHRAWRKDTWDGFYIPKPFSRVDFIFEPLMNIPPGLSTEDFEARRLALESLMQSGLGEEEAATIGMVKQDKRALEKQRLQAEKKQNKEKSAAAKASK